MRRVLLFIVALLLLCPSAFAANYFIDMSDSGSSNNGTWAEPYNSVATLNGLSPSNGDDFYFKEGSVNTFSADWQINFGGVDADNYSVIGCAESDSDFDCDGTKPVIQMSTSSGDNPFNSNNDNDYLWFEYLEIQNADRGIT